MKRTRTTSNHLNTLTLTVTTIKKPNVVDDIYTRLRETLATEKAILVEGLTTVKHINLFDATMRYRLKHDQGWAGVVPRLRGQRTIGGRVYWLEAAA